MHNLQHALRTSSLHRLGKAFVQVRIHLFKTKPEYNFVFYFSLLFGEENADEDSELSDNAGSKAFASEANEWKREVRE